MTPEKAKMIVRNWQATPPILIAAARTIADALEAAEAATTAEARLVEKIEALMPRGESYSLDYAAGFLAAREAATRLIREALSPAANERAGGGGE